VRDALERASGGEFEAVRVRRRRALRAIEERLARVRSEGGVEAAMVAVANMIDEQRQRRGEIERRSDRRFNVALALVSALVGYLLGRL
jgi:hypothetical protein